MGRREEIVLDVAQAAWEAHYCNHWHTERMLCGACKAEDRAECFELAAGFDPDEEREWLLSAKAAVAEVERTLGIKIEGAAGT